MDGHCFGCASKFGFFTKEHSCHKCGHAYCKTCLPHKASLPGKDPKKQHNVCADCYKILQQPKSESGNSQNEGKYSPPENFKKRMAALKQKEQAKQVPKASTGETGHSKSDVASAKQAAKYKNLAPQDRDIAIRLEKLQEDRKKREKPVLPQSEIEERLRKLQGLQPSSETTQQNVFPQPKKTMEEQYDDLLDQMSDEVALDARLEGNDVTPHEPGTAAAAPSGSHTSQPGLGVDPLLPSEDELKQLTEDAKKLLGQSSGNTDQASSDTPLPGGSSRDGEGEREARRLEEEAKKLMEAARAELHLEEETSKRGAGKDAEIAGRLAQLQDVQPVENTDLQLNDDSDEEEERASQRLIQQLLEEDKLDARVVSDGFQVPSKKVKPKPSSNTEMSEKPWTDDLKSDLPRPQTDPDELPWCCICNEDAVLRCLDCDNDLYCKRCFREGHRDFGIESHKIKPYKAPNK